jgi:hypothetical protein
MNRPMCTLNGKSKRAKFRLEPTELESNDGFGARELARMAAIVEAHRDELLRAWHDFFGDR